MKILLLNDNPVVNKLVTLSAQKTSDELEVVESLDAISEQSYDLLVVDDTLYSDSVIEELKSKIEYNKSLYIYSKNSKEVEGFTSMLKKPFLPTDLVELFSTLGKEANSVNLSEDESSDLVVEEELVADTVKYAMNTFIKFKRPYAKRYKNSVRKMVLIKKVKTMTEEEISALNNSDIF